MPKGPQGEKRPADVIDNAVHVVRIATAIAVMIWATAASAEPANLNCKIGPIERTFGGTKWNVYGCDDKKSLVVVTAAGNPAMPFYFIFYADGEGYHLHGDGTGDKKLTDAAYKDLLALRDADIAALEAEVRRH